ncbi:MAG: GAF and ANTAR domain-containing protein, partial [Aeromicrobium sp.]
MALELESFDSTDAALDTIAQYARVSVDADDAGVMVVNGRTVSTPAGTSSAVIRAHELQVELGEGPCLAALAGGEHTYRVGNTLGEERWPAWGKAAADLGYYSVLSSSIETQSHRLGSLNVYTGTVDAFDDDDAEVMKLLAAHAAVALSAIKMRHELHEALASRTTIGQAQGILMHAFDINSDRAFAYMQRLSQDGNIKLFEIAEQIVHNRTALRRGED